MSRPSVQPITASRQRAIALAIALSGIFPLAAHGEVHVEGNLAEVRITTSRDSIGDVLSALGTAFNVQHRTAISLDAPANATYSGSMQRVIASLLDGFNYVVKNGQDKTEIIVFGRRGQVAIPPPAPKPAGILSRWR